MFWRVCALLGGICGEFNQKKGICTIWKRIGTAFSLLQQKWESGVQLQPKNTFRNISFLFRGKMRTESFTLWKSEMLAAQRIFSSTFNQQRPPTYTYTHLCPPSSSYIYLCPPAYTCVHLHLTWSTLNASDRFVLNLKGFYMLTSESSDISHFKFCRFPF